MIISKRLRDDTPCLVRCHQCFFLWLTLVKVSYILWRIISKVYRALHNVLRDYTYLQQENQRTYLNGIFHSHRKSEIYILHLEMFYMCTTGDTAHIDTIFKFLPRTRQHGCILHAKTPSFSKFFMSSTNGLVCSRVLFVLLTKCTLYSNHRLIRVILQHTKRLLPAIFSLHTLTSPSVRNVNYDEKELTGKAIFELFLLSVQVS